MKISAVLLPIGVLTCSTVCCTGVHSCWLNSMSWLSVHKAHHYATAGMLSPGHVKGYTFISAAAWYWSKCAASNGDHPGFSFTYWYLFAKICAKNNSCISAPLTLTFWPKNCSVTCDVGNPNVVQFSIFELTVGVGQTYRQMDGV